MRIYEGAAGVSRINGGVGLYEVARLAAIFVVWVRPIERADNAARDRELEVAKGAAKGEHRLPRMQLGRVAPCDARQIVGVDLDHRNVVELVNADELGGKDAAVVHGDANLHGTVDYVIVGDDVAVGRDDDATADAVLKVNATDLPSIVWGDSTKLKPGQTVLAFGSPFGYFQFSVTRGIVSAVDRPNPYSDDARKPGGYIQTDAAINPGNSVGPLVNAHGELVGINTFIISNSGSFAGAGFAIPSQIVRATTEQLIKNGKVEHGYLGIGMNDVTPDNAHFFNLQDATGAIVSQVTPDSPASRGGLKTGDVISQLNGQGIVNGSALQVAVSEMAPGTKITLGVLRDGKPATLNLTVGQFHGNTEVADMRIS